MSVGAHDAPEERDATHRGDPQVLRRSPPRVETPAWPPQPAPPEAFAPTGDRHDAEGNLLAESAGTWYLAAAPTLNFPIAAGYRYSLLPPNPNASFTALHRRCEQVRDEQLATARRLHGTGNYWFAKVYYFVTVNELANIDRGVYQYPHMKMQEVMAFNATYAQNLRQWEAGNRSAVEPNWRRAFAAAADPGSWLGASKSIANALLPAMEAHIRLDLPRAIAAVFDTHYAGIPGATLDDFRSDFFAMAGVFDRAAAALNPEIDAAGTNLNPANWQWAGDAVFPFIFSVPAEREHAWEKARTISGFAGSDAALESRLHSEMGTAHPNFDSFDVDGGVATGYRWGHQPGMRRDTQPGPVPDPAPPVPAVPDKIFFQLNLPDGVQELPDAVRSDQDLRPLLALAAWTRQVSGAVIVLTGHASSEGAEHWNANLSDARCVAVEHFLFRASADLTNNRLLSFPRGEQGASPTPQWRNVELALLWPGHSKRTTWGPASNLPSEVQ